MKSNRKKIDPTWREQVERAFGMPTSYATLVARGRIPQEVLVRLRTYAEQLRRAKRDYQNFVALFDLHAAPVITALRDGMTIEPGALLAALTKSSRQTVAWRREFERMAGKETANALLRAAPSKVKYGIAISKTRAVVRQRRRAASAA